MKTRKSPCRKTKIARRGIRQKTFGRFFHEAEALPDTLTKFSDALLGAYIALVKTAKP
ncbi:MAG: hypothetical protein IKN04_11425 [Clostridia bacterium]|nr:hypothetical protein [Clostridia bacterium]